MSRLRRSVPLALFLFLLSPILQLGLAQSSTKPTSPNLPSAVQIAASEEKIVLTVPLVQKIEAETHARISANLVNPDDVVWAASNDEAVLRPGQNKVALTIMRPFHGIPVAEINDLHWLRLKYEVKANSGEILASGIEALRTPETDPFVLTAAAGRIVSQGRAYEARAHVQTSRGTPLRGVPIHAELTWEGMRDAEKIKTSARSDAAGNAILQFTLPDRLPAQTGELNVSARHGLVGRVVEHDVLFHAYSYLLLDSDKDIYQPGQTLHARALYFDPKRKAVANELLDVRISDEENTLVSRQSITTSAFGVASFDWAIPMNARQGSYSLQIKPTSNDTDNERGTEISKSIRVYRYDLPNFRVTAKADRAYYLPPHNAEVTVTAEYLFGKPVTHGKVRVVQEEERNWNYRKQQWESEESQVQAGELNRDGSFTARFDLSEKHKDLADSDHQGYSDVNVAAYVTDLSTGRTEQRRLALRVTREPIHVYIASTQSYSNKLPSSYYISTFYADGAPARCKVKLSLVNEDDHSKVKQQLGTVETNKYGLAKATNLKFDLDDTYDTLLAEALSANGVRGHGRERLYDNEQDLIQITGARSILKSGDPIEVVLRSSKPARVVVQAVCEGAVLGSRRLSLERGAAMVTFPYESRFTDEITVVAYSLEEPVDSYRYLWGSRTVLYPKNRNLEVDLKLDKDEHRPGEAAVARINVRLPDKSAAESALGMKVVDHAVAERARTDSEFGGSRGYHWRWSLWSTGDAEFSGVTREDLDRIDLSEPVPEDLDLIAEYLLRDSRTDLPELMSDKSESRPENVFSKYFARQMTPVVSALTAWNEKGKVPRNVDEVRVAAREKDTDLDALRDPWGTPYKYQALFSRGDFTFSFLSAGPDKQFDTKDDFEARQTRERYFKYYGEAITRAGMQLAKNESRFIRDRETLDTELKKQGIDFEALRDPWGKPYEPHFEIERSNFVTRVSSVGEVGTDGKTIETMVWEAQVDYFTQARVQIDRALTDHLHSGGAYPADESEFRAIVKKAGVDLDQVHDPWGNGYYFTIKKVHQYGDRIKVRQLDAVTRTSEPVTLVKKEIRLMSPGPDRIVGTIDDFDIANYSTLLTEQGAKDERPRPAPPGLNLTEGTGAIVGDIVDPSGAVISQAKVTAVREGFADKDKFETTSGPMGNFELRNLPPGTYDIEARAQGFQITQVAALPVFAGCVTEVSFELRLGSVTETVTVEAAEVQLQTESSAIATNVRNFSSLVKLSPGAAGTKEPMSTPRLRQDFPETMLWEPALVTDQRGRARLNFKLADNITTWRLSAIASTKNGELGHAEKDLRAFQPFFVEHDPPRVLTQGDEIAYPVVLRNYLDRAQTLKASIKPETWFALTGPSEVPVHVEPGDSSRAVFRYRASAPVAAGKQQVSAANADISDAAVKPVDVHPFGRQASDTASNVIQKNGTLTVRVPEDAIAGTVHGRVKIYPNLLAHVVENLEAGLERPHGCGEQTISSTYPSLLVAEIYAKVEDKPPVARKAQRYLAAGYERLLRYQGASGGFTYWGGNDAADASLTAYAIEFLFRASKLIDVDALVIAKAGSWLVQQQSADGAWQSRWYWDKDERSRVMMTAYVAQVLSHVETGDKDREKARKSALDKSFAYLAAHRDLLDEPYAIANYALAARGDGDDKTAAALVDWLRKNAHFENGAAYWALERNSPFYSWGRTGRLESTAMAMRALEALGNDGDKELRGQALLFLLRNTDREGMWYSGQTTVQVLKAMLTIDAPGGEQAAQLRILLNGKDVKTIELPQRRTVEPPIEIDVSEFVRAGDNRMDLAMSGSGLVSGQLVAEWYVPWSDGAVVNSSANSNSALSYTVTYSKNTGTTEDKVECRVHAERIGHRGYGMMLGEVGLPPGAEVDRESLEHAVADSSSVFRYEVQPDRVILYVWPEAGGSDFTFAFRPRFEMRAETAPSMLYDYYNPDASVTLKPEEFVVRGGTSSAE